MQTPVYQIESSDAPAWADMAEALAGVGYWRMEAASQRIQWSENMYRIFGFEPGAAPSLEVALGRVHPDDRQAADNTLEEDLVGEARKSPSAVRVVWPSGEIRYVEGRTNVVKDGNGEVIAIVGAVLDVTERKRAEAELLRAKEEAEQAVADKSAFVANVTHELRTPLTAVIGFADLLGEGPVVDKRRLAQLRGAGRTLLSIVNGLLDYSRIEEGAAALMPVACDVVELARGAIDLFAAMTEERGLKIGCEASPALPSFVNIDPDGVRQILVNLVGNAVKFTERGWVRVTLAYEGGRLEIAVEDSGAGVESDEVERLFERYARNPSQQAIGNGLGLAICKSLVSAMGGEITGVRAAGGGARFVCIIPAAEAIPPEADEAGAALAGVRVLVVDDNSAVREIARCVLDAAGALVSEASDGLSAVALASCERFDVLLVDLGMPGISGEQVVRHLRSLGMNKQAAIYAFTASGASLREVKAKGFDGVLAKPIDPAKMLTLVHGATVSRAA
jgi:PAS domain S-box-containing protein